jgi:ribosomal protein S18 acetylase RimI-like enzyme
MATPADAAAVLRLRDEVAGWLLARGIDQWHPGELTVAGLAAHAAAGKLHVIRAGGRVVAAVVVQDADEPIWGPDDGKAGYVHTLVVDRAHAGTGLGRRLLAGAEDLIVAAGRRLARLDCVSRNPALRAYYRAAGYAEVGTRETYYGIITLFEKPLG